MNHTHQNIRYNSYNNKTLTTMLIYLIRHGLTPLNIAKKVNGEIDEPLALEGIKQANKIISHIPKSITQIYSSPLVRAK